MKPKVYRGLPPTRLGNEFDEEAIDLEDTELIYPDPGKIIARSYTYDIQNKLNGFISSDMYKLEVGMQYLLRLRPRRWRWMYDHYLPEDIEGYSAIVGEHSTRNLQASKRELTSES